MRGLGLVVMVALAAPACVRAQTPADVVLAHERGEGIVTEVSAPPDRAWEAARAALRGVWRQPSDVEEHGERPERRFAIAYYALRFGDSDGTGASYVGVWVEPGGRADASRVTVLVRSRAAPDKPKVSEEQYLAAFRARLAASEPAK